jgi:predicted ribosome quality control (RQC) complex YloA/Tae2 family protein
LEEGLEKTMALDGIVAYATQQELSRCVGARIHKIHQPTEHELVLSIRGGGVQGKLLLSANPTYPRVHWTSASYTNPLEAPMFCMLLRKHCEGAVIESIKQVGRERILHIEVRHRDEIGDLSNKVIIVEIMGRHSNIILLDPQTGLIHDGIHHVTPAISSYRIVMPGSSYTAPPDQGKTDPFQIASERQFIELLEQGEEAAPLDKQLVGKLDGISPLLARELVFRAGMDAAAPAPEQLWPVFSSFIERMKEGAFTPNIVTEAQSGKAYFSATELTHINGERVIYPDMSSCLEAFYGNKAERDTVKQRAADLIRFVQNEKAKNIAKIKKLEETLHEASGAEKYRILGELLTAYMHQIKKGDSEATIVNFYDEEQAELTIQLDPLLSPSDNAQRYFRRYTKAKNSLAIVAEQMEIARTEIQYFESLLQQLDSATLADIGEIRDELVEQGYLRDRGRRGPKKKKQLKPVLLCYTSSEGATMFVGKNNTQNEYLTNRLAAPSDTWLHTKDIPGSHVVIRGQDYGDTTLEEAAMLAAHYSQARASSQIPVDYTAIRHVRKPNGAKPGFVIYDNQKTLFITPDEARLKQLPVVVK